MVEKGLTTRALASKRNEAARRDEAAPGVHTDATLVRNGVGGGDEEFLSPEEGEDLTPLVVLRK
ncbi:hypothetical protein PtB15_2B847 [Puccinia triticina]|nr:hypothetical protein PtB15_2B847 [Puccinia triticina]